MPHLTKTHTFIFCNTTLYNLQYELRIALVTENTQKNANLHHGLSCSYKLSYWLITSITALLIIEEWRHLAITNKH